MPIKNTLPSVFRHGENDASRSINCPAAATKLVVLKLAIKLPKRRMSSASRSRRRARRVFINMSRRKDYLKLSAVEKTDYKLEIMIYRTTKSNHESWHLLKMLRETAPFIQTEILSFHPVSPHYLQHLIPKLSSTISQIRNISL